MIPLLYIFCINYAWSPVSHEVRAIQKQDNHNRERSRAHTKSYIKNAFNYVYKSSGIKFIDGCVEYALFAVVFNFNQFEYRIFSKCSLHFTLWKEVWNCDMIFYFMIQGCSLYPFFRKKNDRIGYIDVKANEAIRIHR